MKYDVRTYFSLRSTQDTAADLIQKGGREIEKTALPPINQGDVKAGKLEEGVVIQALQQEKARGRRGNSWESPPGNLYLTIILKPGIEQKDCGQLAFVCACAVLELAEALNDAQLEITSKWPNDILAAEKKLAGILIEKYGDFYAAGIGINVLSSPRHGAALKDLSDKRLPVNGVRDLFLDIFASYYLVWQKEGFAPIRKKWLGRAAYLGQEIVVRLPDAEKKGVFRDLDINGCLILDTLEGQEKIYSGEIYMT